MTRHTISLERCDPLSPRTYELRFSRPASFDFTPGQFIRFRSQDRLRDYTLVNGPEDRQLAICVRHLPEGQFSPTLIRAPLGQAFEVEGPLGYYRFQGGGDEAVFVATGTGVAPFVAFAKAGVRGFTLLHGVGTMAELYYRDLLQTVAGRYVACISSLEDDIPSLSWACRMRVTDYLQTNLAPGSYPFYLSGGADMIHDAMAIIDARFEGGPIYTERFY